MTKWRYSPHPKHSRYAHHELAVVVWTTAAFLYACRHFLPGAQKRRLPTCRSPPSDFGRSKFLNQNGGTHHGKKLYRAKERIRTRMGQEPEAIHKGRHESGVYRRYAGVRRGSFPKGAHLPRQDSFPDRILG